MPVAATEVTPAAAAEVTPRRCWEQLPSELLREVLTRVEESQARWPHRRDVVACASVCRSWRGVMKEIVRAPEASGKITFPISLNQHGPRDAPIKCFIRRNRSTKTFYLFIGLTDALSDDGKFLLAARKYDRPTCTEYLISFDKRDMSKGSSTFLGKLRSNFLRTKYTIFYAHPPHAGAVISKRRSAEAIGPTQVSPSVPGDTYPVSHIIYGFELWSSRGPRMMHGITEPTQNKFTLSSLVSLAPFPFFNNNLDQFDTSIPIMSNKEGCKVVMTSRWPWWHEDLQCWCINFHKRVTLSSVKNFQMHALDLSIQGTTMQAHDYATLQFGKIGTDLFTMDYLYPLSAYQAFAICLSTFGTKISFAKGDIP